MKVFLLLKLTFLYNMITHILALVIGFIAGALVFRNNAAKAASLEAKSKSILDALKGK